MQVVSRVYRGGVLLFKSIHCIVFIEFILMWESDADCHFEGEWKYLLSCDRPRLDSFLTGLQAFVG